MKCKNCSAELGQDAYFCFNCGKLVKDKEFKNSKLIKEYEEKMITVINGVKNQSHVDIAWNATVDKYIRVIEKLKFVLNQPEFNQGEDSNFIRRIDSFVERCKKPEFHIAFVGTINAGKSTLINSLLGKNVASTSVTPETAVLTKFRHCEKDNYVKVKFYNEVEWKQLWASISNNADIFMQEYKTFNGDAEKINWIGKSSVYKVLKTDELESEIERWTSSKKVEHYFVKEVEIGMNDFAMPPEVVFVDTPGLDDAVKYRSDVTRNYIDRANAVFACVKSDSLTGQELNTLYRIFSNTSYNPEKVYIIGTQWDSLNNPQIDWENQKGEWIKYLSRKDCYGNKELAVKNITYTAAYVNNLARDYEKLNDDESWSLQSIGFKFRIRPEELESRLSDLIEMSNVSTIERKIDRKSVV